MSQKKYLNIHVWNGQYYEPTITVEVTDTIRNSVIYDGGENNYCSNIEELVEVLVGNLDLLNRELSDEINEKDIEKLLDKDFDTILDNFQTLQELKSESYNYNLEKIFGSVVYNNKCGYGDYAQEVIILSDLLNIALPQEDFDKLIKSNLKGELGILLTKSEEEIAIIKKETELDFLKVEIENDSNFLKELSIRIEKNKKRIITLNSEIESIKKKIGE
jgi:hypothetical protein